MHTELKQDREFCWCNGCDSVMAPCFQTWADLRLFTPLWKASVDVPNTQSNWAILIAAQTNTICNALYGDLKDHRSTWSAVTHSASLTLLKKTKNKNDVGSTAVLPECVSPQLSNPKIYPTVFSNSAVLHNNAGVFDAWCFLHCGIWKINAGTFLYNIQE